jgi:hypothetical protein
MNNREMLIRKITAAVAAEDVCFDDLVRDIALTLDLPVSNAALAPFAELLIKLAQSCRAREEAAVDAALNSMMPDDEPAGFRRR